MDHIRIDGITAVGHHGVYPDEKANGQPFVVDLVLEIDLRAAGASDDLADTVSYADVAALVADDVAAGSLDLIEALAARLARRVLDHDDRIGAVVVTVHKPEAPIPAHHGRVAVTIRRTREDQS